MQTEEPPTTDAEKTILTHLDQSLRIYETPARTAKDPAKAAAAHRMREYLKGWPLSGDRELKLSAPITGAPNSDRATLLKDSPTTQTDSTAQADSSKDAE